MQHPILKVLDGGGDTAMVSGRHVLGEIVALLDERIPTIRAGDPSLPHLRDLHAVLRASMLSPQQSSRG